MASTGDLGIDFITSAGRIRAGGHPRVAHRSGEWPCEVDLNPLAADLKNRPPATLQSRSVSVRIGVKSVRQTMTPRSSFFWAGVLALLVPSVVPGQQAPPAGKWTAAEDHQNMMEQLGIKALRPGPSGNESAPNHANYDEATANPFPILPDVLTLEERQEGHDAGDVVESAPARNRRRLRARSAGPRSQERPEGDVDRHEHGECDGRIAHGDRQTTGRASRQFRVPRRINVDIQMTLVTPADAKGPVPVMMMFGGGALPGAAPTGRGCVRPASRREPIHPRRSS